MQLKHSHNYTVKLVITCVINCIHRNSSKKICLNTNINGRNNHTRKRVVVKRVTGCRVISFSAPRIIQEKSKPVVRSPYHRSSIAVAVHSFKIPYKFYYSPCSSMKGGYVFTGVSVHREWVGGGYPWTGPRGTPQSLPSPPNYRSDWCTFLPQWPQAWRLQDWLFWLTDCWTTQEDCLFSFITHIENSKAKLLWRCLHWLFNGMSYKQRAHRLYGSTTRLLVFSSTVRIAQGINIQKGN